MGEANHISESDPNDESLQQFIEQTSPEIDPARIGDLEEGSPPTGPAMQKLNRSRRRYE